MADDEYKKIFSKNLGHYMNLNNKNQMDLINDLSLSSSTISNWCTGLKLPRMGKVQMLADYFGILKSDLSENKSSSIGKPTVKGVPIKVLGRVAAGVPIEVIEDIIGTEEISEDLAKTGDFFGLKIHGDSMEPRMFEGDIIIVRQQDDAESGDIVIAMVNGSDATCKRLVKYASGIGLISLNGKYEPMNWCINVVYRVFIKNADGFVSIRLTTFNQQNQRIPLRYHNTTSSRLCIHSLFV